MRKFIFVLLFSFIYTVTLSAKLKIVTSIYPLYSIAHEIAGEKAELVNILPPGISPHIFEPRPSDILKLRDADVFIYVGKEVEPWAKKLLAGAGGNPVVVEFAKLVPIKDHNYHLWLDPLRVKVLVKRLTAILVEKDPGDKDYFTQREEKFLSALGRLDEELRNSLSKVKNRNVIFLHNAWYYLARRYHLHIVDVIIRSEGSKPTPREMVKLANEIKKYNIKVIFGELLGNTSVLKRMSENLGVDYILLDPLGCSGCKGRSTYLEIMKYNLKQLLRGLNQ